MGILAQFLELQRTDSKIHRIRRDQERLPKLLEQKYLSVTAAKKAVEDHVQHIKQMQLQQREKEGKLNTFDNEIVKKTSQRNVVKTNKEYSTLTKEIEQLEAKKSEMEEAVLELMELIEEESRQQGPLEERVGEEEREFEKQKQETRQDLDQLQAELEELEHQRKRQQAEIEAQEPEILHQYERVLRSDNSHKAMVAVEEDACSACYLQLLQNDKAAVLAKKIIFCKGCGRLLYLP